MDTSLGDTLTEQLEGSAMGEDQVPAIMDPNAALLKMVSQKFMQLFVILVSFVPLIIVAFKPFETMAWEDRVKYARKHFREVGSYMISPVTDTIRYFLGSRFATVPNVPYGVKVTGKTYQKMHVSWKCDYKSFFNVDEYELNVKEMDSERGWRVLHVGDHKQFMVTLLDKDTRYKIRVRTINKKGSSDWSEELHVRTPQTPNAKKGGKGEKYDWHQSSHDVTLMLPVPKDTKAKDIIFDLKTQHIKLAIKAKNEDSNPEILLEGKLFAPVHTEGQFWEFTDHDPRGTAQFVGLRNTEEAMKNKDKKWLYVEIEKAAWGTKMPTWRYIVEGDPEIELSLPDDLDLLGNKQWGNHG
ncbi:hypothetical protein CYMTET_14352 [Cymbomonas tetramitiformis]|uniref:Fibronectin type-III domain-containing protein n=1 Tax=Cymbomonas tetramitiformis TaxID=36881 RepID=A0AAE0LAG3_9CHLO|nr:hypothetical protein CYMTET_14352 [Cymbomonas tetramitiformis]